MSRTFLLIAMEFFVYILYSSEQNIFYKGQTNNLHERIHRHSNGYEKSTCRYNDLKLIWSCTKPTRSEALILETKLKNLSKQRLIDFMLKYNEGIAGPDELLLLKQLSGC